MYDKIMLTNYVLKIKGKKGRIQMNNKFIKLTLALVMALSVSVPAMAAPTDVPTDETEITATPVTATGAPNSGQENTADAVALSKRFSDINTNDFAWARPYINDMTEKGYISGYEDGTYRPDNDVTRQEALSLFARAMGSNDEMNAEILEIAHERYDAIVKNYKLTWGDDDIVYLMYKGALKKTDLDTYLKDNEKNTPMARYEAAIIITKALGGEEKALADLGVVLNYSDAREVPSNAIQYVSYASEAGIMSGMGDGTFSPTTPVKRSQIAVMLSKTADATKYSFKKGSINAVDTADRILTVDGEEYAYDENTKFKVMGDDVQAKDMPTAVEAVITLTGKTLAAVDTISSLPDETVTGKYVSHASTSGKTTIRITLDDSDESKSYECLSDVTVTYDGSPATLRSFTKGDVVTLELKNGKVARIIGDNKITTISGAVVNNIDVTDGVKMTISHSDSAYDGKTFDVSSDVKVKKNDSTVGLDSIYKGDKVKLELQYGVIISVQASSSTKTVEGTIRSLTIGSPDSTMTVNVKGEEKEYTIPKDVQITVNGSEGSLYDFRVGDSVKITTESDAITRIVATSTQESSGNVVGVVTGVNTSYGVVSVKIDGQEMPVNVFCKDDSTTFVSAEGKTKKMKDVQIGQTVDVRGTVSNGVFVGKLFVIVADVK